MSPAARPSASSRARDIAGRLVDAVSFQAAQRADRAGAGQQSRSQGGAGSAARRQRTYALAQRGAFYPNVTRQLRRQPSGSQPGALAPVPSNNAFIYNLFTPQVSVSYVPDVFGLTRRTVESLQGAGRGSALSDDRGLYHPGQQCGGRRGPGRRCRGADRRHPRADRRQHQNGGDSAGTSSPRAMPAAWILPRRKRNWRRPSPRCRR